MLKSCKALLRKKNKNNFSKNQEKRTTSVRIKKKAVFVNFTNNSYNIGVIFLWRLNRQWKGWLRTFIGFWRFQIDIWFYWWWLDNKSSYRHYDLNLIWHIKKQINGRVETETFSKLFTESYSEKCLGKKERVLQKTVLLCSSYGLVLCASSLYSGF